MKKLALAHVKIYRQAIFRSGAFTFFNIVKVEKTYVIVLLQVTRCYWHHLVLTGDTPRRPDLTDVPTVRPMKWSGSEASRVDSMPLINDESKLLFILTKQSIERLPKMPLHSFKQYRVIA